MGAPSILNRIQLPKFDGGNPIHSSLLQLSLRIHAAAASEDLRVVASLEVEVDKAAARLWGITDDELGAIQKALGRSGESKWAEKEDGGD